MDIDLGWLGSEAGGAALALAQRIRAEYPGQATAAAATLQRQAAHLTADQRAAALAQAELRELATDRYGIDASSLLLTRAGLEQATRPEISAERVRMLDLAAGSPIVDATAGLGFDTRAFVAAGLQVTAVEQDPSIVALLRSNAPQARILHGDVTEPQVLHAATTGMDSQDVIFLDPARRDGRRSTDGSRARPERDPQRWSPPWSFVLDLATRFRVCVKTAPGFLPDRVPAGWCAAWLGTRNGPVEAFLCSWLALPTARRACLVIEDAVDFVDEDAEGPAPACPLGAYLHEPARIVQAADLIDALARRAGVDRLAPDTHWLTSRAPIDPSLATGLLTSYRIVDELPTTHKAMRAALRARGITDLTIKSRGSRADATAWRARLRMPEGPSALVAIWEANGSTAACLVDRCP